MLKTFMENLFYGKRMLMFLETQKSFLRKILKLVLIIVALITIVLVIYFTPRVLFRGRKIFITLVDYINFWSRAARG